MADSGRQSQPDLTGRPVEQMDFFELLRTLERGGAASFGYGGRPDREPARLGQEVRMGFATRDVAALTPGAGGRPPQVTVALLGLLGPEGPLPLHLTRRVLDRLAQRWFSGDIDGATSDTTFLDFANMLQHRAMALYYRAWADQFPPAQFERDQAGRVRAMLAALSGAGLDDIAPVKLGQAAPLAHQVLGPERLTGLLAGAIGLPVRVTEFVGTWSAIPRRLQTRLGGAHATLGLGATLGPRSFSRQGRIELRVGPLGLAGYRALMPGNDRLRALRRAILHGLGETLDVDVRPVLRRAEVPAARLGDATLGRVAWIAPRRDRDADDLCIRAVVGLAAEGARAAA
jgi:type VI secretion system protein ImpH